MKKLKNSNNIKGFIGEQYCLKWLKQNPLLRSLTNIKQAEPGTKGIDFEANLGSKKIAIQVKKKDTKIDTSSLCTFLEILDKPQYNGGIFLNFGTGSLTDEAEKKLKEKNVHIFNNVVINDELSNLNKHKLRDYQEEAVKEAKEHYKNNNRGLLEMACGTGKTFVSKHIMKSLLPDGGIVFYFVPWINLLEQSALYFNDSDILIIPICSQEDKIIKKAEQEDLFTTDIMDFSNFLDNPLNSDIQKNYKYIMFFCTYQSHDRLADSQKKGFLPEADLIICDEAHHMTYESKINEKEKNLFQNLHENIKNKKALFMTATVKILLSNKKNKDEFIDMSNKDIFGEIFYSLDLGTAIKKNILCDYDINISRLPDIDELKEIEENLKDEDKNIMNELIDNSLLKKNAKETEEDYLYRKEKFFKQERLRNIAKIVGIIKTIENNSDQKNSVIAFVNSNIKNKAKKASLFMENIINNLKNRSKSDSNVIIETDYIAGSMTPCERKEKLDKLIGEKSFVLWNCRCLTEGVDIPGCNTVVFFDHKNSALEITQAIGRILRQDPHNPNKKANIILLPFENNDDSSFMRNISFENNKNFLKILKYIFIGDSSVRNNLDKLKKKIDNSPNESTNSFLSVSKNKTNDNTKDQANIDFVYKYLISEVVKYNGFSWHNLVLEIKNTLKNIKDIIQKDNQDNILAEIKEMFGTILNIDEKQLEDNQTVDILSQYILFYPILQKIYEVKCSLFTELDVLLKKLVVYEQVKEKVKPTIDSFYKTLNFEYKSIDDKGHIFNQIYNDLLKETDPKLTLENGMWYTPGWVVEFLWDLLLKLDPNLDPRNPKNDPYHVIDPSSGTASFIVHFIQKILKEKETINKFYNDYLHMREIHFLAFMISVFKIAIAAKKDEPPKYIHWGDTLKNESKRSNPIANQHKGSKEFTIIVTNPPWKVSQQKDEGKTKISYRKKDSKLNLGPGTYWVDDRIKETFIKQSEKGRSIQSLYNMYRRFVRWSLDHIDRGWIAMVLPNSFLTEHVDGFRRSLTEECQKIYLVNLKGAQGIRVSFPEKEGANIFVTETQKGNTQGVVLLLCFKDIDNPKKNQKTYYHAVPDGLKTSEQKYEHLKNHFKNFKNDFKVDDFFEEIELDQNGMWFNKPEIVPQTWQALTAKDIKTKNKNEKGFYFETRKDGLKSGCTEFVYDKNLNILKSKIKKFIDFYEKCRLEKKIIDNPDVIKWHDKLKDNCLKNKPISFDENKITTAMRRPFEEKYLYLEPLIISDICKQDQYYQEENISLCISYSSDFFECLVVNRIPDKGLLYTIKCYAMTDLIPKKPYNRKEWMAILYALFHHTDYKEKAKNFLKSNLPTIPYLTKKNQEELLILGQELMKLHLNYKELEDSKDIYIESNKPNNFIQYHRKMPFLSQEALDYKLFNKPILYSLRDSDLFPKLVTLATKTTDIRKRINKIVLNLQ
jgi:predicted helicase